MSPPLRLHLLGTPLVEHAGSTGTLPLERRAQLLVWLAVRGGWATRADVAALLWPDAPQRLALANTRKALFRLQASPWAAAVQVDGAALRAAVPTDIGDFDAALAQGRIDDALAAWRGEPMAGFDDGQSEAWTRWLTQQQARLRNAWRGAVLKRVANPDIGAAEAAALTASLVQSDPFDEAALAAHLDALVQGGQQAAARQAYRTFAERLVRELGIEPGAALRARHAAIDSVASAVAAAQAVPSVSSVQAAQAAKAAKAVQAVQAVQAAQTAQATQAAQAAPSLHPVPADDGFVGRGIELQRIVDLLARPECRLLSLIGPGGVGKTRLARRVLGTLAAAYADGAVFVAADELTQPAHFGPRLADALGIRRPTGGDALQAAADALQGREQLIVIDNFEDLAPFAAALLDRLLAASPRLKLLVTSRVRLQTASEWSMPLDGLPVPDPEDADRADAFDAVRLFVQSARRVEPGFAAATDAAAIVDICRQVEGLPLALELAAAWVRVLPPKSIAAELRAGLELLRARDASQPARHASIDVVFDASWRRLVPAERDTLARLSVFRGGFTPAAARAVAAAALPVLGALADKSLLRKDTAGGRLSLHPLVQQLASAKLAAAGLSDATAVAHATHVHRWLHSLQRPCADGNREALAAIDADWDNVRQAWLHAASHADAAALSTSGSTLLDWAENRARFDDSLALWRHAIDALPASRATRGARALLDAQAARIHYRLARYADAETGARRALDATSARAASDREARHVALAVLASCASVHGRFDDAMALYAQALAVARAATMLHAVAGTLENQALVSKRQGRYAESLALLLQALAEHRRIGDSASVALSLSNLGSLRMFMHDDAAAAGHLQEALMLAERDGLVSTHAFVLANLTELALRAADWSSARRHAERALAIARASAMRPLAGWLELQLARLAVRRGELDAARAALAAGAGIAVALNAPGIAAAALMAWADLLQAQGLAALAQRVLAFGAAEPQISAPDRDELRVEWARRAGRAPGDAADEQPWPSAVSLEVLLGRLVSERSSGHAALIAALGGV